jgi:hypothetical protein
MAKETPHIYVMLEDQQTSYHATMVRLEGKFALQSTCILINPESTHSYVTSRIVEECGLKRKIMLSLGWCNYMDCYAKMVEC